MQQFFDVGRVYEHIEELCYPRRVGTPGERQAARYILREFAALGLERKRESFPVPMGPTGDPSGFTAWLMTMSAEIPPE